MLKQNNLFVIASGSGGHILPALVLSKQWKEKNKDGKIIFFSGPKNIDKIILDQEIFLKNKVCLKLINFPNKKFWLYPKFICQFLYVSFKSFYYLFKYKPETIITTGGYLAIPLCLLSKLFNTKTFVYELNVVPGKTIKFLIPFINKLYVVFNQTKHYFKKKYYEKIELTNYPLRYSEQDKIFDKTVLIKEINEKNKVSFELDKKTIFLLGGSQGSLYLNNYLKKWIEKNKIIINNLQFIHQTGVLDKTNWIDFYKNLNIPAIVFSYKKNLKDYYLLADLVICRAGAGTLFELEFFKKKSLIIPLKTSYTSHQVKNAEFMIKRNPALFCNDKDSFCFDEFNTR